MKEVPTPKGLLARTCGLIASAVWSLGLLSVVLYVSLQLLRSVIVYVGMGVIILGLIASASYVIRRRKEQQW